VPGDAEPVVLDAGDAWFEAGERPTSGTVCGVFRRAAYLRASGRILAICGPGVAAGPLHLRLDRLPALHPGQPVTLGPGRLHVGPGAGLSGAAAAVSLDLRSVARWAPGPVDPAALAQAAARAGDPAAGRRVVDVGLPGAMLKAAARRLRAGDLTGVAHLVGGRGPGLTPAGDDLLAGALVADAALRPGAAGARRRAAAAAPTTDVAAAFLRWAAEGQCIQPVHDVIGAMAAADRAGEGAARARLAEVGASSGAALLLGLDLALGGASTPSAAAARP
jgi:hypothetical protein